MLAAIETAAASGGGRGKCGLRFLGKKGQGSALDPLGPRRPDPVAGFAPILYE